MTSLVAPSPINQAIVARAQAGDHDAFEALYTQFHTPIWNYLYRLTNNAETANDLTADTFVKVWLALPHTSDDLRFHGWAYRIATNVFLDFARHNKLVKWQPWEVFISVFHPSQTAKDSPERDVLDHELRREVRAVLGGLHPKYRRALTLREYGDRSYDEIAREMDTTRAAVKSLLFRARQEFGERWQRQERRHERLVA